MKRRKKRLTTRKRSALGWITALVLVVTAGHLSGVYCLTPGRALRNLEQENFCGRTEWLCRLGEPSGANRDLRLSAGEHAVILGEYRFSWDRGWQTMRSSVLARDAERPFSAGLDFWTDIRDPGVHGTYIRYFFIYGVLESTEVAELEITFDAQEGGTDQTVRLTKADWFTTESGERFFLCALEPEEDLYSYACCITAYDANGGELGTFQAVGIPHWE